ncbi:13426_t:CDS:2 [Dentiscutata erythropus]|uniref:13426_t:CDS:1 n=1 Tax=Dentiscutata erythropus TaxID=1348616 RepID=A0A9N9BU42_9GLOM|nr:13426_t:CDS:2 [Dentiscutata erythropus]
MTIAFKFSIRISRGHVNLVDSINDVKDLIYKTYAKILTTFVLNKYNKESVSEVAEARDGNVNKG